MMQIIYYALCGLGWVAAAAIVFGLGKAIRHLRRQPRGERWPVVLLIFLVTVVVGFHYLLAYPVAFSRLPAAGGGPLLDLFVPAEWLYDHTPLRGLMHMAGSAMGVAEQMEDASRLRMTKTYWGSTPPVLYAAFWLALGGAIVGSAVWLALRIERLLPRIATSDQPTSPSS